MKHLLLLLGLLLGQASAAAVLPADTLKGQAQFVNRLSSTLCERLTAEGQKTDLSKLSAEDAQNLLTRLVGGVMGENFMELQTLLKQTSNSDEAQRQGGQLGEAMMLRLIEICPASHQLVAQLGLQSIGKKADLSVAERQTLMPVAESICQRFDADNAKQPYEKMTPVARRAAIEQAMSGVMMDKAQDLQDYYGEDTMQDEDKMHEIGTKIGLLVLEKCPRYLLLIGRDEQANKAAATTPRPSKSTPAAKATHRPAAKRPAKK